MRYDLFAPSQLELGDCSAEPVFLKGILLVKSVEFDPKIKN